MSTIGGILKNADEILHSTIDSTRIRVRNAKHPELEEALYHWHMQKVNQHVNVSEGMLLLKAEDFGTLLNIKDFKYSSGWLHNYKKRFNISYRIICGESGSLDQGVIIIKRQELNELCQLYEACDVYNLDETALFYK